MVSGPKMDEVVCAQNLFKRREAKPILQATIPFPHARELSLTASLKRGTILPCERTCGHAIQLDDPVNSSNLSIYRYKLISTTWNRKETWH
jgi:hypothetical protein